MENASLFLQAQKLYNDSGCDEHAEFIYSTFGRLGIGRSVGADAGDAGSPAQAPAGQGTPCHPDHRSFDAAGSFRTNCAYRIVDIKLEKGL